MVTGEGLGLVSVTRKSKAVVPLFPSAFVTSVIEARGAAHWNPGVVGSPSVASVRNGANVTWASGSMIFWPTPAGLVAMVGPLGLPHQLNRASSAPSYSPALSSRPDVALPLRLLHVAVTPVLWPPPPKSPILTPRVIPSWIAFSVRVKFATLPPTTTWDPIEALTTFRVNVESVRLNARNPLPLPSKTLFEIVKCDWEKGLVEPSKTAALLFPSKLLLSMVTPVWAPPAWN